MSKVVDVNKFLEELENTHIVLFHDGNNETKKTEYNFIKKGLESGQHCFYTTQKSQKILGEMREFGINTENNELLHIVDIPNTFENYSKMILDKVEALPEEAKIRVISTHYFDFNTEEKTDRMAEIEQCVDDGFSKINGNFLCSFEISQINQNLRDRFLNQLLESHKAIIFQTKEKGTEVFTLP
ncbi:MAG: MEDS domain-containing protein [Crenarchaeota archaeon]|nr:MEDS domain-containing protein [Thermoproteota archaeon]MDA1124753.1 MEDS domain-containing protein [Thermoproteota archaeon]